MEAKIMKKVLFFLAVLLLLSTVVLAAAPGTLEITAPEGVSLKVYDNFEKGNVIQPTASRKENGSVIYTYPLGKTGVYRWESTGTGFYSMIKTFYVSADKKSQGMTLTADPGQVVPGGFQAPLVKRYTDEVMENLLVTQNDLWKDYEHVFTTPFFTEDYAAQQQTTQDDMMEFLRALDDPDDDLYLYSLGKSPVFGYDIPIVVFSATDLSSAKTLEEAAALVNKNEKATIHYQGLIHANEPAAGEGCLAMIGALDGDYGEKVLPSVNVYCIPRFNPDGARLYQRANASLNVDMNRDHLFVQSEEVAMVHHAYNLFLPEVVIDGHEFNSNPALASAAMDDVQLGAAASCNSSAVVNALSQTMIHQAQDELWGIGLRAYHYSSTVNNAIGRAYYGLQGSISFLIETRGIHSGVDFYERRVLSHYASAESFINYVVEHHDEVVKAVADGREHLVECGATYEESDQLVLNHKINSKTQKGRTIKRPTWDFATGTTTNPNLTKTYFIYNEAVATRTRPTAYVIPKGEAWAERAVYILTTNGVAYYELEPGAAAMLQQYQGKETGASRMSEALAEFPAGAYVFPMNQYSANVLAMTMEPDVTDTHGYNGTLAQSGVLTPQGGVFPLYCSIRNLDAQGKIETVTLTAAPEGFTVVQPAAEAQPGTITGLDKTRGYDLCTEGGAFQALPAGIDKIENLAVGTYYLRYAASGSNPASAAVKFEIVDKFITEYRIFVGGSGASDSNHGRLENAPVATLTAAYETLDTLMQFAPEGTQGKIVFLGTVTLNGETELPAHSYPVVLEGKDGAFGISGNHNITFNGETTLRNMTVTLTKSALFYFSAGGHKMVIEETVTTKPSGEHYYNLTGGRYKGVVQGGADLTVKGGTWRNVYACGHQNSMSGVSRLTMTGGTVNKLVQPSYASATVGDVIMDLSGVNIQGDIYCGNVGSKNINGNVTLILGEGLKAGSVYCGSRDAGDVLGIVEVVLAGGEVTQIVPHAAKEGVTEAVRVTIGSDKLPNLSGISEFGVSLENGSTVSLSNVPGTVRQIRGGGTLVLPAGKALELDAVQGVTVLSFETLPDGSKPVVTAPLSVDAGAFTTQTEGKMLTAREENGRRAWYLTDAATVTFLSEGETVATVAVQPGSIAAAPTDPTREGFRFTGWRLPDGSVWDASQPIAESLTLTAVWEAAEEGGPEAPAAPQTPEAPAETVSSPVIIVIAILAGAAVGVAAYLILKKKK